MVMPERDEDVLRIPNEIYVLGIGRISEMFEREMAFDQSGAGAFLRLPLSDEFQPGTNFVDSGIGRETVPVVQRGPEHVLKPVTPAFRIAEKEESGMYTAVHKYYTVPVP